MSISTSKELNFTLEDGRWKDSFDKLLEENTDPRNLNVLKKKVRASFNIDSSVENSKDASVSFKEPKRLKNKTKKAISTPVGKLVKHPFKCKISPIVSRNVLKLFKPINSNVKLQPPPMPRKLQSTILHPPKDVLEYSSLKQTTLVNHSKSVDSLEILLTQPKKVGKLTRKRTGNLPVKGKPQQKERKPKRLGANVPNTKRKNQDGNFNNQDLVECLNNPAKKTIPIVTETCQSKALRTHINLAENPESRQLTEIVSLETKRNSTRMPLKDRLSDSRKSCSTKTLADNRETEVEAAPKSQTNIIEKGSSLHTSKDFPVLLPAVHFSITLNSSASRISKIDSNNCPLIDCDDETVAEATNACAIKTSEQTLQVATSLQPRERSSDAVNSDMMVTVRKSRNTFKNLNSTKNVTNKISSPKTPKINSATVEKRQSRRISKKTSKNAIVENISEETSNSKEQNLNNTKTLPVKDVASEEQTLDEQRTIEQSLQVVEKVLPHSDLEKVSSAAKMSAYIISSDAMVTVRKKRSKAKSMPSRITEQSDESSKSAVLNVISTETRQCGITRKKLKLTRTTLSNDLTNATTPLAVQNVTNAVSVEVLPITDEMEKGTSSVKRFSDALITIRKSNNCSNLIASNDDNRKSVISMPHLESSIEKQNCEQSVQKDGSSSSVEVVPNSLQAENNVQQNIIEMSVDLKAKSLPQISNPKITIHKNRQNFRETSSTKIDDRSHVETVKDQSEVPSRNKPTSFPTDDTSSFNGSKNMSKNNDDNRISDEEIDSSLINFKNSLINKKSTKTQTSILTLARRKDRAALTSSRVFKSRSQGRTLCSVQEIINENDQTQDEQTSQHLKRTQVSVHQRSKTVKFHEASGDAETGSNDSDVILIEENEKTDQNRRTSRTTAKKSQGSFVLPRNSAAKSISEVFIEESSKNLTNNISLQPGKWRKSLSLLRRSHISQAQIRQSQRNVYQLENIADDAEENDSVQYIGNTTFIGKRKTIFIKPEDVTLLQESFVNMTDYEKRVLRYCNQKSPAPFDGLYAKAAMQNCSKIGEGVYGEVFMKKVEQDFVVCKIIPIEGTILVNGEVQKNFEQILPEIVISKELSNLKEAANVKYATNGFVDIKKVACVKGKYPQHLIKCWEDYDKKKTSDNDHPGDFVEKQLYIVLELEFAGKDLESFVFKNAEQSFAALQQIVLTLAVAEEALEFEHRDLHWGNVLIRQTNDTEIQCKLSGETLTLPTKGIKATIIDYTLSRMKYNNHCFYNDLADDEELFTATGDYQFDIYRMMRDLLGSNWERFEPKTNVYWLSYIISKMENGVKYKNARSRTHLQYMRRIGELKKQILEFGSASSFAKHMIKTSL